MPPKDLTGNPDALAAPFERLAETLGAQIEHHRALRSLVGRKREAIRTANIDEISELCERENEHVQVLGNLEKARLALVGALTQHLAPDAAAPLKLRDLAGHADGPRGRELTLLGDALRAEIEALRRESSIVRSAADALSRHMSGILQTVNSALSRVRVYERRGRLAVGSQVSNCVDVTS